MPQLVYDLPPGTMIDERYKLLKVLGQGGFGITYIAWDTELKRRVAVKECFPAGICLRGEDGGVRPLRSEWEDFYLKALDDMRKEARTLAALNHESIVRIYDVIWGNGSVFCVMPWLGSGSLKERMGEASTSAEESIRWLRQLLDALEYLHARDIIHRDLKPDNIMFDEAGSPIIIDFGAALNRPELTTTTTQGSFSRGYAAPEQITGKGRVGPWTDFYALSATWYELLTGIRPEASDARLMQDDLKPLSSATMRMSYPSELVSLLQLNLSLKPAERCQTVEQWLNCWQNGTLPELAIPRHGRLKRLLLTSSALVALGCGVAYTAWQLAPTERESSSLSDLVETKNELKQRVRAFCKVDEYASICADYKAAFPKVRNEYDARLRELSARVESQLLPGMSSDDAEKLRDRYIEEYDKLVNAQSDACVKIRDDFYQAESGFCTRADKMREGVKPTNRDEALLLSEVCSELEQEMRELHSSVISESLDFMEPDKERARDRKDILRIIQNI